MILEMITINSFKCNFNDRHFCGKMLKLQ